MKRRWPLLLIVGITFLTFYRAFFAEFVMWDDDHLITNNILLKMPLWEFIRTAFSVFYHGDYFPITLCSYWLDFNILGLEVQSVHVENVIWHAANATLLFLFLNKLCRDWPLPLLISLIFAIHPLQTES